MLFYLTSLHVSYVLTDSEPVDLYVADGQNVPTKAQVANYERVASQWNHNEYNCRNYILNALDDSLYDIYSTFPTVREIWESLEKKYGTQVACSKKFVIGKFLNFKMIDAKPVVKQVEELQIIVHEMKVEGMGINSNFLQLVLKIRVEEDNRINEKADANLIEPNANMIAESSSKSKSNHKNKGKNGGGSRQKYLKDGKKDYIQQKNNNFKKACHCWVCGKPGHKAKDFHHKKEHGGGNSGGNSNQANHVQSPKEVAAVIESFLTTNVVDWWYDTCCTKNICNSRRMFVSYQKVNEPEPMFMGNGTASKIKGKGKVILKLTSGKDLVLSNVLHVPNITKNLISGPILSNKGFKLVIESDKFVITKGGMYVGKGNLDEGLFKLSVVTDDNAINNNNVGTSTASVYTIDPSFLWHSRLGHVNFRSLQRMINLGAPHSLWGEACLAANTILNKFPHKKSDKSRYQLWKEKQPSYKRIKDKEKQISNLRKRVMNDQLSQDEIDNNSKVPQENVEPRRSKHAKVTKDFGHDYMTYIVNEEPQTYKAVMESSEAPYWKETIQSEIDLIVHNNTWKLVDLPSGHKPIGHK
ncbi:pol polyprotein [Tanacetum coccineum]